MQKEPPRILAVNPGSRYIGIAAFRGPEILDWGVKVVIGKTPAGKLQAARKILIALIEQYRPDVLAIKRLHCSRSSRQLNALAGEIKNLAKRRGIKVREYSIQDVKTSLCPNIKSNKRKLGELLAAMYPALAYDLEREAANRNPYRTRMFEAVALAAVCWQEIEDKNK
jgi:Holliday junction resolvasome RuvABC endonuclease subunit